MEEFLYVNSIEEEYFVTTYLMWDYIHDRPNILVEKSYDYICYDSFLIPATFNKYVGKELKPTTTKLVLSMKNKGCV